MNVRSSRDQRRNAAPARFARSLAAAGALACAAPACDGGEPCTEIGCSNKSVVTYDRGVGGAAYTLVLSAEGETVSIDCNGPASEDAPPGIACDALGFELDGHPFADRRSLVVTVTPEGMDPVIAAVEVILGTVETLQPNGEGCEPTCFVRSGRVLES